MKRVTIRVPATTANLGPGFDAFGCALSLYTDVTFEETDSGLEITGCDEAYTGPDNLAYTAYCAVLGTLSEEVRGVKNSHRRPHPHLPGSRLLRRAAGGRCHGRQRPAGQ